MYFLSIGYVGANAQRSRFQDIQCALRIRSVIEAFSGLSSPSSLHSMKISSSPRNTISHTHSFLLVSGFVSVFLVARSIGQFFFLLKRMMTTVHSHTIAGNSISDFTAVTHCYLINSSIFAVKSRRRTGGGRQ